MASSKFENIFLRARSNNVNYSAVIFLLTETFQDQVVANGFLILNKIISAAADLEHEWVGIFADFALKRLPEER